MSAQANKPTTTPPTTAAGVKWRGDTAIISPSREHLIGAAAMVVMCLLFAGYKFAWFFWVPLLPFLFIAWVLYVRTTVGPEGISTRYMFKKDQQMAWEEFSAIQFDSKGRAYAVSREQHQHRQQPCPSAINNATTHPSVEEFTTAATTSAADNSSHPTAENEAIPSNTYDSTEASDKKNPRDAKSATAEAKKATAAPAPGAEDTSASAEDTVLRRLWLPGVSFNSLITLSYASAGRIPDPVTSGRNAASEKVHVVHKDGYEIVMSEDEFAEYKAQRQAEYDSSHPDKEQPEEGGSEQLNAAEFTNGRPNTTEAADHATQPSTKPGKKN